MSQENVEIVRRMYAEFERGNFFGSATAYFHPDIHVVWIDPILTPEGDTHGLLELTAAMRTSPGCAGGVGGWAGPMHSPPFVGVEYDEYVMEPILFLASIGRLRDDELAELEASAEEARPRIGTGMSGSARAA